MTSVDILHVNASARTSRSLTRSLADKFAAEWRAIRPDGRIIIRDVGQAPPPMINEDWISAAFTPEAERTAKQREALEVSDALIAEVRAAHIIVIAAPMYNYGMPASLKAWIDQVVRVDETFDFNLARGDFPLRPLLSGKSLVLLTSSGEFGFRSGGVRDGEDHLAPHLKTVSKYLGAEEVFHVAIEYQEFGDHRHEASVAAAHAAIPDLAHDLAQACADNSGQRHRVPALNYLPIGKANAIPAGGKDRAQRTIPAS